MGLPWLIVVDGRRRIASTAGLIDMFPARGLLGLLKGTALLRRELPVEAEALPPPTVATRAGVTRQRPRLLQVAVRRFDTSKEAGRVILPIVHVSSLASCGSDDIAPIRIREAAELPLR